MDICVRKTCNLFERKGSHTFCVSKAFIRIEEADSEEIRHIDLKASGVAVCNRIDEFNLEFGKALAQSRADKRLDRKIEKFLVKLSEKNTKNKITPYLKIYSDWDRPDGDWIDINDITYRLQEVKL